MPYDYETQKFHMFTEQGQIEFLHVRDKVKDMFG